MFLRKNRFRLCSNYEYEQKLFLHTALEMLYSLVFAFTCEYIHKFTLFTLHCKQLATLSAQTASKQKSVPFSVSFCLCSMIHPTLALPNLQLQQWFSQTEPAKKLHSVFHFHSNIFIRETDCNFNKNKMKRQTATQANKISSFRCIVVEWTVPFPQNSFAR